METKPQETLELELNKQIDGFAFSPPIIPSEEGKWLLAVTCYKARNSVSYITDENNSFSITTPEWWIPKRAGEIFNKVNEFWEHGSQNAIQLHVKEVEKGGICIDIENSG